MTELTTDQARLASLLAGRKLSDARLCAAMGLSQGELTSLGHELASQLGVNRACETLRDAVRRLGL